MKNINPSSSKKGNTTKRKIENNEGSKMDPTMAKTDKQLIVKKQKLPPKKAKSEVQSKMAEPGNQMNMN